eukprot:11565232-Prorocentrum_lima.AAC.1
MQDPSSKPILIALGPLEQDILFIGRGYWITPEWTLYGLPEHLEGLLEACKRHHARQHRKSVRK